MRIRANRDRDSDCIITVITTIATMIIRMTAT